MIAERDARIAELSREAPPEATGDLEALEKQLVERGHELRRLERELAESERIGRELIVEVGRADGGGKSHELLDKLDALSDRLATSEADRLALRWAVEAKTSALEHSES